MILGPLSPEPVAIGNDLIRVAALHAAGVETLTLGSKFLGRFNSVCAVVEAVWTLVGHAVCEG